MSTWKKINEVGGTVILRVISGALAALVIYGVVVIGLRGNLSLSRIGLFGSLIFLFGSYAVLGNGANRFFGGDRRR
jgi:hypothetical protein